MSTPTPQHAQSLHPLPVLFLIAGHDLMNDPGALAHDGTPEAQLTASLRDAIAHELRLRGWPASLIITDDDQANLRGIIHWLNHAAKPADLALEIHFNHNHPTASGTEVFVHDRTSPANRKLAAHLAERTARTLDIPNRGLKGEAQSARGRLGILHTRPRVLLWEVCFLNPHDLGRFRQQQAALAREVAQLLGTQLGLVPISESVPA